MTSGEMTFYLKVNSEGRTVFAKDMRASCFLNVIISDILKHDVDLCVGSAAGSFRLRRIWTEFADYRIRIETKYTITDDFCEEIYELFSDFVSGMIERINRSLDKHEIEFPECEFAYYDDFFILEDEEEHERYRVQVIGADTEEAADILNSLSHGWLVCPSNETDP